MSKPLSFWKILLILLGAVGLPLGFSVAVFVWVLRGQGDDFMEILWVGSASISLYFLAKGMVTSWEDFQAWRVEEGKKQP